jgi:hypothetical protein
MRHVFATRHGLFVNPRIWRGPKTVVSDHLRKHGVDIKTLGFKDAAPPAKPPRVEVMVIFAKR